MYMGWLERIRQRYMPRIRSLLETKLLGTETNTVPLENSETSTSNSIDRLQKLAVLVLVRKTLTVEVVKSIPSAEMNIVAHRPPRLFRCKWCT